MNTAIHNTHEIEETEEIPVFTINKVSTSAPIEWFDKGVADFKKAFLPSFTYGLLYVAIGLFLIWLSWENPIFLASMVTGFFIIGPVIAVGFYCMSRTLEQGGTPHFSQGYDALRFNAISLASFSVVLAFILGAWTVMVNLMAALFFDSLVITDDLWTSFLANKNMLPFSILYFSLGYVFAIIAFAISVISIPLITNNRTDVVTAMMTSVKAVKENPIALFSWALMIVALVTLGMLFFYIGLAITLPIVGHASWHAYKDLVSTKD